MKKYGVFEYDPKEHICWVLHPDPIELQTREDISIYFDTFYRFWQLRCGGKKIYLLVDYENLSTNPDELEFYSQQVNRIRQSCAIAILRFGGTVVQRITGRMSSAKNNAPSNVYPTRDDALKAVRALRHSPASE